MHGAVRRILRGQIKKFCESWQQKRRRKAPHVPLRHSLINYRATTDDNRRTSVTEQPFLGAPDAGRGDDTRAECDRHQVL